MDLSAVQPRADLLIVAAAIDAIAGDPVYRLHPVRLMGGMLSWIELRLRSLGADGFAGGILLFLLLAVPWTAGTSLVVALAAGASPHVSAAIHLFALFSLLALGDLLKHGSAVDRAAAEGDLRDAREKVAKLVGRDVERMDLPACRRAAIESLAENLADGFVSPLFWYVLAGLPGIVLFKVVSTMDSMVGHRTVRYLRFGWCGARLDDAMNLLPARLTWACIGIASLLVPGCSARAALAAGLRQHAVVPGPNAGWSEASMAGAIRRRLAGPIWMDGKLVTEDWIGRVGDGPAGSATDYRRATAIVRLSAGIAAAVAVFLAW